MKSKCKSEPVIKEIYKEDLPVNWPKRVEVMHHNVMDVLKTIHFPKGVQVSEAALPPSRDLIEGSDSGAAF